MIDKIDYEERVLNAAKDFKKGFKFGKQPGYSSKGRKGKERRRQGRV